MKNPSKTSKKITKKSKIAPSQSLDSIYSQIERLLARHAPPFLLRDLGVRNKRSAQLEVPKPVAIPGTYGGKPVNVQMAAVILQKGYVGFYLMCVYMNDQGKNQISPALLKLRKGKSCFHVKQLDDGLRKDIEAALVTGTKAFRGRGWL